MTLVVHSMKCSARSKFDGAQSVTLVDINIRVLGGISLKRRASAQKRGFCEAAKSTRPAVLDAVPDACMISRLARVANHLCNVAACTMMFRYENIRFVLELIARTRSD